MNTDLLHAKQLLSARHLSLGFRSGVVGRMPTISVAAAISSAARNVHAVGIGRKVVEGKTTRELSVRLYVVQKLAKSLLPPRDLLPETIDGVPVDVIEFESGISDGAGEPLTLPGEPGSSLGTAHKCGCSGGRGPLHDEPESQPAAYGGWDQRGASGCHCGDNWLFLPVFEGRRRSRQGPYPQQQSCLGGCEQSPLG